MPRTDRLGVMVNLVMIGLALSVLVSLPSRVLVFVVLGSDLSVNLSGPMQLAGVMGALVCAGVDSIVRTHPLAFHRSLIYTVTFWVLPTLLTLASLILVQDLTWWGYRIVLISLTGVMLALVIVSQYRSIDPTDKHYRTARLALNVAVYAAALVLFVAIFESRYRSVISATGVFAAGAGFALELLRSTVDKTGRTWLYALLTGLLMGELTWALNYYSIDARVGGAFLLLVFYVLTGLMQQHLWGRLSRHVVVEYGVISAVGLTVLGAFAQWFRI